jgi:hypothetical protein
MYETIWNLRKKVETLQDPQTKKLCEELLDVAGEEADLHLQMWINLQDTEKRIDKFILQIESIVDEFPS